MYVRSRWNRLMILLVIILSGISTTLHAQTTDNLTLTLIEDRKIGTDCPQASALSPSGTTIWVLMDNCEFSDHYFLHFNVGSSDFELDTNNGEDYASSLLGLDEVYIDSLLSSTLTVGVDGFPQLLLPNSDGSIQSVNTSTTPSSDNSALGEILSTISDYPEFSVFNNNHTMVAANGADGIHILDVATSTEVLSIEIEGGTDYVFPQFSPEGQSIDLIILNNPEDPNSSTSTLYRYSIPDGELQLELDLLSSLAWLSPNGQYVLLWMGDDELVVTEPATGGVSDFLHMYDEPRLMTDCANDTSLDPSTLEVVWSGFLPPIGIHWLPDSSGFVTLNSYMGAGAESIGSTCAFSESRLRLYRVGHEN